MIVEFLEEAAEELTNAAIWYEAKEAGLGVRFRDEIFRVINRIAEDPLLWRERAGGYRRVNCPVFPYCILTLFKSKRSSSQQLPMIAVNLVTGKIVNSTRISPFSLHFLPNFQMLTGVFFRQVPTAA